jgi:hypothetical protein
MSVDVDASGGRARVVVVHADEGLGDTVAAAVAAAGFAPWLTASAQRALAAFHPALPSHPIAVVVDVGLQSPYVFEVVDALRALPVTPFVITIGAAHNPARYRRRPTSLHGADAHVDAHDATDALAKVLAPLRGRAGASPRDRALADWALDHVDELDVVVAAGGSLATLGGAAGAALDGLRLRYAKDADFDAAVAQLRDALARTRAEGRPFG